MNGSFADDWAGGGDGPAGGDEGLCGLDDELVERLLDATDAESLPVAVRPLAKVLVAVRAPATAGELAGEADAVAQFRATRTRQNLAWAAHSRRGRRRSTALALAVAATLTFVSAAGAAAAAGRLPDDLQDMASQMLSKVGITVPSSRPDHPPTRPDPADHERPLSPTPAASSTTAGDAESDPPVATLDAQTSTTRRRNSTVDPAPAAAHGEAAITETPIADQQEQPVEPLDSTPTDVEPASPGTPTTTQPQPSTAPTASPPPQPLAASEPNAPPSEPPSEPPPPAEGAPLPIARRPTATRRRTTCVGPRRPTPTRRRTTCVGSPPAHPHTPADHLRRSPPAHPHTPADHPPRPVDHIIPTCRLTNTTSTRRIGSTRGARGRTVTRVGPRLAAAWHGRGTDDRSCHCHDLDDAENGSPPVGSARAQPRRSIVGDSTHVTESRPTVRQGARPSRAAFDHGAPPRSPVRRQRPETTRSNDAVARPGSPARRRRPCEGRSGSCRTPVCPRGGWQEARATLFGMGQSELEAIRRIALALPEVTERWSHGAPCFFVRRSRPLCYFHDDHHGDGRTSLWCPARPGVQEELVSTEPERFFRPPTSARGTFSNWVGVFLDLPGDDEVDWDEIAAIIEEAYCVVAPKELIAQRERR